MGIDDGRGTHLEILLRLLELLRDRHLLGLDRLQVHLGQQDVEVGLRHAQDHVLAGLRELSVSLRRLHLALLVRDHILPAEKRLRQRRRVAVAVVLGVRGGHVRAVAQVTIHVVPLRISRDAKSREQTSQTLRFLLAAGILRVAGGLELRVVIQREAIDLQQVGGKRRGGRSRQEKCRDKAGKSVSAGHRWFRFQ